MYKIICSILFLVLICSVFAQENTYQAGDQSLLFMPTAYTMPKGTSALTDYEVIVIQYAYAAGNYTHLSAMTAFPVSKDALRSFTVGIKQNYLRQGKLQSAFWVTFTPDSGTRLLTAGNVFSYGTSKTSGHAAIAYGMNRNEDVSSALIMLGGTTYLSKRVNLMGELTNTSESLSEGVLGIFALGIRFKGNSMSWDLGGFRPLSEKDDELFALPYLKATFVF